MKQGQKLSVQITDVSRGGAGVGRDSTGQVVFVPKTAAGDFVDVEVVWVKKRYIEARLLRVVQASPLRIEPKCTSFAKCGGCDWQHLPYFWQWAKKKEGFFEALTRAGFSAMDQQSTQLDEFRAPAEYGYRNRVQLRTSGAKIGYLGRKSQDLVPIDDCPIAHPRINQRIQEFSALELRKMIGEHKVEFDWIESKNEVRLALDARHGAFGFRQINDEQNRIMKSYLQGLIPRPSVSLENPWAYDLYGGSGNFSECLAHQGWSVHCVDISSDKSRYSGPIELVEKINFHEEQVSRWLSQRPAAESVASVVLDPPREGLDPDWEVLSPWFQRVGPESVFLIGCDPDSFARDVVRIQTQGYRVTRLALFDLFPQTHHIESVASFLKKN